MGIKADYEDAIKSLANYVTIIMLLAIVVNIYSFSELFVQDKATGLKSLMISMGLKRTSLFIAYTSCMSATLLPVTISIAVVTSIHLFNTSLDNPLTIILLYILITFHIVASTLAVVSFITSTSYVPLIAISLFLEMLLHNLSVWWMEKSSDEWQPFILFLASVSPFESSRIFCQSFLLNANNGTTTVKGNLVSQPTYLIIIAVVFWSIIGFAFAAWFDQVCPWQVDSAIRKPFFCLERERTYQELATEESSDNDHHSEYFEQRQTNRNVGIFIRKITKLFNNIAAVNEVTFKVYKGETTLLLGHNGAGKSTLMNMILGLLRPDSGKVAICGLNSSSRSSIGVCPQASVLDDSLTVRQHLDLFVDLKSEMSSHDLPAHILRTIGDVSLGPHANKRPPELSGGMKRKLSLALAFVGNSEVLILDEPSSGLDPDSRVFIWNAIRRYRVERTVLLSTQHMEEADYLGDRIAIMRNGRIVCCGSSVFLNKKFGTGYKLRIECHQAKTKQVLEFIKQHFQGAKQTDGNLVLGRNSSQDQIVDMVVELRHANHEDPELDMINLLDSIENNGSSVGIISHGLRSSSIEDVMLNTSKYFAENDGLNKDSVQLALTSHSGHIAALADSHQIPNSGSPFVKRSRFLRALLIKQLRTYLAHWKSIILFRMIIPAYILWQLVDHLTPLQLVPGITSKFGSNPLAVIIVFHFVYYPVLERTTKFKIVQFASHSNFIDYWLANFLVDMISVIIDVILVNIFLATTLESIYKTEPVQLHLLTSGATLMFGLASIIFAYVASTILSDPKTSMGYLFLVHFVSFAARLVALILQLALSNLQWLSNTVKYIFVALLPVDAFQYTLYGLASDCHVANPADACQVGSGLSPILVGFIALATQIASYSTLLYLYEVQNLDLEWYFNFHNLCPCFSGRPPAARAQQEVDQDVAEESAKALSIIRSVPPGQYSLVTAGLSKSYVRRTKVIDGLSFTVNKGECFGLLGVNGAGKSTTFSMLTAEIRPDAGTIWANGFYTSNDIDKYRKFLGYDPQSNPDMALTPNEALYLMARLRNVNEHGIPMLVSSVLELLEMSQHAGKSAKDLSGGTKRKLALAMALVGNPSLLILDEPSAGVDPVARRGVWQLLKSLRAQNEASIIISSHAMEECEAICDRIAIMARGQLRCVGTFLHLRSKFARGCSLKVQFGVTSASASGSNSSSGSPATAADSILGRGPDGRAQGDTTSLNKAIVGELQNRLESSFGRATVKLTDSNVSSATFEIANRHLRRSMLFRLMRDVHRKHPQISYMINDSSLEDIFISLAREQQAIDGLS